MGPIDALFPKSLQENENGRFKVVGLSREPYANSAKLSETICNAFAPIQLHDFTPHSFRKMLALYGDKISANILEAKAWSLNFGHSRFSTTVNAYMPVDRSEQRDLIRGMRRDDRAA